MVIRFIGSDTYYQNLKISLLNKATVVQTDIDTNIEVYEVSSLKNLYSIPKTFKYPTFFLVTVKDETLHSHIKDYPIKGIFFPPINPDNIMAKFKQVSSSTPSRSIEEYNTIRIKILAKAESIPPLPALAEQLIRLTRSDSSTIKDVCNKIKMDQGISSKVIKLVNSPFYGMKQEISSIDRATVLLGFNTVKNIAAAISMEDFYSKPFNMYKTTGKNIWLHSYKTACISQLIAKELNLDEEALYMAGLLHDVGKIIMTDFLVKEVETIEDEKNQLGMDHTEVGALILKKWSVSTEIVDAVKNHHDISTLNFSKALYYANKFDNTNDIDDTLLEMSITMGIKDVDRLKNKIIQVLEDLNAEL